MQDQVRQTAQPIQAAPIVEIGQDRCRAARPPYGRLRTVAQQGVDAIAPDKTRERAAGNVPAADD